jgi:hypothetical protein
MASSQYRIERSQPLRGSLLPPQSFQEYYSDRGLAVAVAVKSLADPTRQRIRVVHVDSGEVVFDTRPHGSTLPEPCCENRSMIFQDQAFLRKAAPC